MNVSSILCGLALAAVTPISLAAPAPSSGTRVSWSTFDCKNDPDGNVSCSPLKIQLSGVLYRPDNFATRTDWPAVVMLHGCRGMWSYYNPTAHHLDGSPDLQLDIEKWGRELALQGVFALAVDSYEPRRPATVPAVEFQKQCISQGDANAGKVDPYVTRRYDARSAWSFLSDTGQVAVDKIGLLGWSQGAETVMVEAAATERDSNTAKTSVPLFDASVAFYPGCGPDLGYPIDGAAATGFWRPQQDFRLYMGGSDSLALDCPARIDRARSVFGATAGSGREATLFEFAGTGHNFDSGASEAFPTHEEYVACKDAAGNSLPGDQCARVLSDRSARAFLLVKLNNW